LAEIVEDDVRVVEGTQAVRRFRQIEIELTEAAPDDVLETLCVLLRHEGAGAPDPVAKDVRALGERASRPELEPPALDARSPIGDVARAAFVGSVERLVRLDAALRLREGEEAVHHARVAVRRLRSDLRSFLPLLDSAWACDLRERLRRPQDGLSAARDADVLLALLRRTAEALPEADRRRADDAVAPLRDARESAYRRLDAMLRERQYVTLLQDVVDAAKRPAFGASASAPACDAIPELVGDAYAVLRKRVRRRARPPSDRDLHAIRIAAKRVRYALEAVVPVAGRPARVFARRVEQLQTVLGEQHDAAVARDRLRTLAAGEEGCDAFVVGELAALAHRAAVEGRDAWRDVWRRVRRARRRFLGR
ncbi:MAG: domain containing protein, partial [Candidatus Eremiobacteraeota bacterium]|nr:domain containing protein [Candidatus Eremiobacteraeota bacterium]